MQYGTYILMALRFFSISLLSILLVGVLFSAAIAVAQSSPDFVSPEMAADVSERISKALRDYEQNVDQLEGDLRRFHQENSKRGSFQVRGRNGNTKTFSGMPRRHPLLDSDGVADTSQQDYTEKDTKVIMNPETFGPCFEERQVFDSTFTQACEARCPVRPTPWRTLDGTCRPCDRNPLGGVPCGYNQYYVSEVYLPVYQSRTYPGRAMGSFDPTGGYLAGEDKRAELTYEAVRDSSYQSGKTNFKAAYKEYFDRNISDSDFSKALPASLYKSADYTGRDLSVDDNGLSGVQALHTLVYMTNFNRQLSRGTRPPLQWLGYALEDKCFANVFPDGQTKAIAHSTYANGNEKLNFAYNHRGISEGRAKNSDLYGFSMLDEGPRIGSLINSVDAEWEPGNPKQLPSTTNWMLGQYIEMNLQYYGQGLQRMGTSENTHYQDALYHSFFRLYHSRNFNHLKDPLYAGIASAWSFYTLNSLKSYANNNAPGNSRPLFWSFYRGRPNGRNGQNYTGENGSIGPGKIFSVDKIQVIYPTVGDGDTGSHCFRPESLSRSAYVEDSGKIAKQSGTQGFYGFRRDLRKELLARGIDDAHNYVREVRLAYWIKRVNCHCTMCSWPQFPACSVLNSGDMPEENFYGTTDLNNSDPVLTPGGLFGQLAIGSATTGPGARRLILEEQLIPAGGR